MKRHVNTAGICCFRVLQGDGGSVNLFGIRGGTKGGRGGVQYDQSPDMTAICEPVLYKHLK